MIGLLDATTNAETPARFIRVRPEIRFPTAITPDGKAVAYVIAENGAGNVWVQPLDGSPGHQVTNFTSDQIVSFRFSPDGKMLAVARLHLVSDPVLLRDSSATAQ